jgi:CRP-like cAMP-binding protein
MLSTIEKVLFLRSVKLFDRISDDGLTWIADKAKEMMFSVGEQFITQGDPGECLYIAIHGQVDIVINDLGKIATLGERDVIGDMAILCTCPRMANCIAATDVAALKIDREQFLELLHVKPELALGIIQVLVSRLEEANSKAANH